MKWIISKPGAVVGCRNGDVYFVFVPFDHVGIMKSGSDLIMELSEGKGITFQGFYCKDVAFQVDDRVLSPKDFFSFIKAEGAVLVEGEQDPDVHENGRSHDWESMAALERLDHQRPQQTEAAYPVEISPAQAVALTEVDAIAVEGEEDEDIYNDVFRSEEVGAYIADDKLYEEFMSSLMFSPEEEEGLKKFLSSRPDDPEPGILDQPDDPPFI